MLKIMLDFSERYVGAIPNTVTYPGIYVVYAYNNDRDNPKWVLLDIGQADNIYDRHLNHERAALWREYASARDMSLIYYLAKISNENNHRTIAEAALIFRFQPLCDVECKNGYHHENVMINVAGKLQNAFGSFVQCNTDK